AILPPRSLARAALRIERPALDRSSRCIPANPLGGAYGLAVAGSFDKIANDKVPVVAPSRRHENGTAIGLACPFADQPVERVQSVARSSRRAASVAQTI